MKILRLFPLPIVVYPGEILNLHIFEPRYKELITECLNNKTTFGIPTYLNKRIPGMGTEMNILDLVKKYENGEMDITVKGENIFRIINFYKKTPNKLYSSAEVEYLDVIYDSNSAAQKDVLTKLQDLFRFAGLEKQINFNPEQHVSYLIAHTIGLTLEQEYELLSIKDEQNRLEYISDHLTKILPVVSEFEQMKGKIKMNGHFKNFPEIDF